MSDWQYWEEQFLAPWAAHSRDSKGRLHEDDECPLRTPWQRDRDRIIHCKAFRRLKHKTQVVINPKGDHFRTRLTHTLEVAQISRTVSRALHLNEDLTEAIALGHDLGHTPFGHAGERAMQQRCPEFSHNRQSLRIVDILEHDGRGLNLTAEVRDGILCHTGAQKPATLEGAVVRICDRVAYLNHDIDDAIRSGYLHYDQIPLHIREHLGDSHSRRINTMVNDIVENSTAKPQIMLSEKGQTIIDDLRAFMFATVYGHPIKITQEQRLEQLLLYMFDFLLDHPEQLPDEHRYQPWELAVCDYISGMTDTFALEFFHQNLS